MDATTRFAVQDLYTDYVRCVDDTQYHEWPDFFKIGRASCRERV